MARIRSIHPGLFTDEAFVSLSPLARVFLIGIWTEADDQGVVEWKPVTLKMRVLPADNADADALLDELVEQNIIARYEVAGKSFGALRNFRKYQRPKKPNAVHPLPDQYRTYVGITDDESGTSSEPVRNQFPTASEIAPQMEDVGGRRKGEKERTPPTPPRGQRQLPEDWEPTEADVKFAIGKGYDRRAIAKLGQAFKLHHRAKGNRYSDWHLAFCKWVNNDLDRPGKSRDGPVGLDGKPIERVA